ncbi:O-antigen ligase family protein [Enterococcus casseliflavus]|uniref:O-antigen ligase family protein n=1 Tax=Enterococcus casseliflavus TaxID=37734 RepID=UPI0039A5F29E
MMNEMDGKNINNFFLIVLLYISPIVYLTTIIVPNQYLLYAENAAYFIFTLCLLVYNKFKFKFKTIAILVIVAIVFLTNALLSQHPEYVIPIFINFSLILIPTLIVLDKKMDFQQVFKFWEKFALLFTVILPVYIVLNDLRKIGYYEIGYVTHVNLLFYAYLFSNFKKNFSIKNMILLILNVFCCFIFGSRSVLAAGIVVILVAFFMFQNERKISYYFILSAFLICGTYLYNNLAEILINIQFFINKLGFSSRNLSLFIQELNNNEGLYLSGRDGIYPIIIDHLKSSNGLPEGVGMARVLTSGNFYHAHNFLLEMLLTFGLIIGTFLIVILLLIFVRLIFKKYKDDNNKFLCILLISFLTRSIFGTYFFQDTIFVISICLVIRLISSERSI